MMLLVVHCGQRSFEVTILSKSVKTVNFHVIFTHQQTLMSRLNLPVFKH